MIGRPAADVPIEAVLSGYQGDPTKDINVLKDYQRNLLVIIKDGKLYKNRLPTH